MNITELHDFFLQTKGISIDTRNLSSGSLFFALSGENFNGNTFAHKALEQGAALAVIDDERYGIAGSTLLVEDTLKTLQELARYHRDYLNIPIIALTGSNGKTTTKELIYAVLSKKYKVTATQGNLNNHIGVPLTLLSMNDKTEIGLVEMGANHIKEIEHLCTIARPDVGYITNFGKAHLEGFGSEAGVVQGKSELYSSLRGNKGQVILNADDPKQIQQAFGISVFTFGMQNINDLKVHYGAADPYAVVDFEGLSVRSQLIGDYNATNIAAAIAFGSFYKVDKKDISSSISNYVPANNRSQIIKVANSTIILDAYNANPSSMEAALKNFAGIEAGNKIVFLGDMFEMGKDAEKEHRFIASMALAEKNNLVILIGENFAKVDIGGQHLINAKGSMDFSKGLPDTLAKALKQPAHILIKGSRGMALERLLPFIEKAIL